VGGWIPAGHSTAPSAATEPDAAPDTIDAERPPVVTVSVERDQIPAGTAVDHRAWFRVALGRPVVARDVCEVQPDPVAARAGDRHRRLRIDLGTVDPERGGGVAQCVHSPAQASGQYLLELGKRPNRGLLDPGDRTRRGRAKADRHRHGLCVVEQQRRKLATGAEAIATGNARSRLDGVAERAQLFHVATDRPGSDLEAFGELLAGPFTANLQQRKQGEQAGGRLDHEDLEDYTNCGQELTATQCNGGLSRTEYDRNCREPSRMSTTTLISTCLEPAGGRSSSSTCRSVSQRSPPVAATSRARSRPRRAPGATPRAHSWR